MTLSFASCTFAYTQEQQDAYNWAYKYGITTQSTIEAANLNWKVTRQAFAKMVINYLENVVWIKQTAGTCSFPDENRITNDLKPYTKKTCAYNIMWSNWKSFKPTDSVDRAQLWTVLSRVLWGDEYDSTWWKYYIYHLNALKYNGIMNNIENPQAYAKRWDVMIMLKRIYEKFGSNVYMNENQTSAYDTSKAITNSVTTSVSLYDSDLTDDDWEDYVNTVRSIPSIIYTWDDGTQYEYDEKFLKALKKTAEKKWESDLVKYLDIEIKYLESSDKFEEFDPEEFSEEMWIDFDNLDKDNLTKKEKEEIVTKFKAWVQNVLDEAIELSDNYEKDLAKLVKNIKNDKFWLNEKYENSKKYNEIWKTFVKTYCEIMGNLLEVAINGEDEEDSSESMASVFGLLWASLIYQSGVESYEMYLAEWSENTIKLLGWKLVE